MNTIARIILLSLLVACILPPAYSQAPARVGWWKFDDAANPLKAETGFGSDLELVGNHEWGSGPSDTNGSVAIESGSYYKMTHGIAANGGGAKVNEFSLQIDFLILDPEIWYTFFQVDPLNADDGECFINTTGHIGVNATGYSTYSVIAEQWYRLVISVKNGTHYRYYLDGQLLLDSAVPEIDGRFALENILLLFADNDGDDGAIFIAEAAIWDKALTSSQVKSLGGYENVLPVDRMQPVGKWKFDNDDNLTEGLFGQDLELVGSHQKVEGPAALNKAVRIGVGSYYKMEHSIAPNGGGAFVNDYTMQFDFKVADIGSWRSFFQTNPNNNDDADCFINDLGKIGASSTGYSGYKVIPDEWYRLVISVENGEFFRYYLDGQLLLQGEKQDVDGRYSLKNLALLFADNDGEDADLEIAETAIWDWALPDTDVVKLGGFGHSLTDTTVTIKKLVGQWKFDNSADLLKAEPNLGLPLELVGSHNSIAGPAVGNGAVKIGVGSYYKMTHGIIPNGGGFLVNEFSLQIDFRINQTGFWHSFFQTDPANGNDSEFFINTNSNLGVGATGYSTDAVIPNEWYRLVLSVKNNSHFECYLDGHLVLNGSVQSLDGRFALDNILLIFADEDGEDNEIQCAELAIWNYPLTLSEVKSLGGFGHYTGIDNDGNPIVIEKYDISQNYPNPFNPRTTIVYSLAQAGRTRIDIINTLGQTITTLVDDYQKAGQYSVHFDGSHLPSGVYFYRIKVNEFTQTRKMILFK